MAPRLLTSVALLWALCGACTIEREFPEEDARDTAEPPEIPPFTEPVRALASFPLSGAEDVPLDSPLWFALDQYLDPDAITSATIIRVQSGGVFGSVQSQYHMVDRRIVGRLRNPLQPGFEYSMTLDSSRIRSVTGAPMLQAPQVRFTTGTTRSSDPPEPSPLTTWADDIAPIVERSCGCHQLTGDALPDPWFEVPTLTPARLVGQPSLVEPDRLLVTAFEPARSVLMERILPDFPRRTGTVMPPPWAGEVERTRDLAHAPLTVDEMRLFEAWIRAGAQ